MIKEAEHYKPIMPDQLDKHINLLNAPNGIINLTSGELMPHNREKYLTKITNSEYADDYDAPLWGKFLNEIFNGDKELIRFLQKAVGYSLTGSTKEDCLFICYGGGRNGKGTFLNTLADILGGYAINIQPETIMAKTNYSNGPTSDIARMMGARFVTVPEPNEGARLNEGLVKQMTGGDMLTACRKYEDEFEFKPEFKIWMMTNHKPKIYGTDVGIWSRIRLIPFTVHIPDEKADRKLRQNLMRESPGILKWAVDGCSLWQREGLGMPEAVRAATAEYKTEMDTFAAFLNECCVMCNEYTSKKILYEAYLRWAESNKEKPFTNRKWGIEMQKRFKDGHSGSVEYYTGIKVKPEYAPYSVTIGGEN